MDYATRMEEHRRLGILRILKEDAEYETNEAILQEAIAAVGISSSRDQVRVCLAWLEEQGLVTVKDLAGVQLAKITVRGLDAARGLARVPGVARPGPGE